MSAEKEIIYWAKVTHASEYLHAQIHEKDLTELEAKIEASNWTQVELLFQTDSSSFVKVLEGEDKGLNEFIDNKFIVSEQ